MKYVPGPMFGQLSGSQGNTVASRGRAGSYVRNRVMGTNPASAAQVSARGVFTDCAKGWALLSNTNKVGWNSFAETHPIVNTLGQSITITGLAWFSKINCALSAASLTLITAAPVDLDVIALSASSLNLAGGVMEFSQDNATAGTERWQVWATPPVGLGVYSAKSSRYALIATLPQEALAGAIDFEPYWSNRFGAIAGHVGQRVFVRIDSIRPDNAAVVTSYVDYATIEA